MMQEAEFPKTWERLSKTVSHVVKGENFPKMIWNDSFQDVYKICIAYPYPLHKKMYCQLQELLTNHCRLISKEISDGEGSIANKYIEHWKKYDNGSKILNMLFQYFNNLFVAPNKQPDPDFITAVDENQSFIYTFIEHLSLNIWKNVVIEPLREQLVECVMHEIDGVRRGTRSGGIVDCSQVCNSFVEVERFTPKTQYAMYKEYFEKPYLEELDKYLSEKSKEFLQSGSCSKFMELVLNQSSNEMMRNKKYLNKHSFKIANERIHTRLVYDNIKFLQDGCKKMINEWQGQDMWHMYMLLKYDNNYLKFLADEIQAYIANEGIKSLQGLETEANLSNAAALFVDRVLKVYTSSKQCIEQKFEKNGSFMTALDRAITIIVNHRYEKDRPSRSPDLVCKFCDMVLKKSRKENTEPKEAEEQLDNAITVFRYIEDKDIFQRFYSRQLAKRLINQTSSMDLESEMIGKLRGVCGYDFISKFQCMINDVRTSVDHSSKFHEIHKAKGDSAGPQLQVNILQQGAWPLMEPKTTLNLPNCLTKSFTGFCEFYKTNNKGKNLSWLHHLSTAEVKMKLTTDKTYIINMPTFQVAMVLLYNDANQISIHNIQRFTNLPDKEVVQHLKALVNADILNCDVSITKETSGDVLVRINEKFYNRKTKFKTTIQQTAKDHQVDTSKSRQTVEIDRKNYLRAAVTRIMKSRKECKHNELIQVVLEQARKRFTPSVQLIKLTIEYLIDKCYLERSPAKKDTYLYVA